MTNGESAYFLVRQEFEGDQGGWTSGGPLPMTRPAAS